MDSENNYLPKVDIRLGPWRTYRDIANEASISRKYGGIHIAAGDIQGRVVGQKVEEIVWRKLQVLFNEDGDTNSNHSKQLIINLSFYLSLMLIHFFLFI